MSYPLSIQALVIEDQDESKETYERIFAAIAAEQTLLAFRPAPPLFAFSYDEAIQRLESSKMFHVVILDLRLPRSKRLPPPEGVELGVDLLKRAQERHSFPIPSLLIISGHIEKTEQDRVQQAVTEGFHYGRMFAKGNLPLLEREMRHACAEAIRYCSVGIHIRDSFAEQYPTIAPDEDDLLRRCVLTTPGTVGLDLSWWSADLHCVSPVTWTKVLVGRFLLSEGQGASRPQFFKLFPGGLAQHTYASAHQFERKLSHIKVTATLSRPSRALMVTEKVGAKLPRPVSLEEYLKAPQTVQSIKVIIEQIQGQLDELGDTSSQSLAVKGLLWKTHDIERIRRQWETNGGPALCDSGSPDPISIFAQLLANDGRVRFDEQSLVHGDLHLRNIALDENVDGPEAYIFDSASSVGRHPKGRDLAMLEVSAVIHQDLLPEYVTGILLPTLYGAAFVPQLPTFISPSHVANTALLVKSIRETVVKCGVDEDLYSLMVLDNAMIQLGGLEFGVSPNSVRYPQVIVHMVSAVSRWYQSLSRRAMGESMAAE